MKKILKYLLTTFIALLFVFISYVIYVYASYNRLPDKLALEIERNGEIVSGKAEETGDAEDDLDSKSYSIVTYNIGFGAYRPEYSFFMDGGKSSWGKDKESVTEAVCMAGELVRYMDPDFVLFQEVDRDGTRSYHIDELELLHPFFDGYYCVYAQNYDSPFLFYPFLEPHGANRAGIVTYSKREIADAVRRSLPISESFSKLIDLDRCYSIVRIPLSTDKMLCIYNIHMSAYGSDDAIRTGQLAMLYEDMEADYRVGNYVICGGDFNHNLKTEDSGNAPDWAYPFPRESLPEGFRMAIDEAAREETIAHNTCRSASEPYQEAATYTVTLDGFIVSDNVTIESYAHIDTGYEYSDHEPVAMRFKL